MVESTPLIESTQDLNLVDAVEPAFQKVKNGFKTHKTRGNRWRKEQLAAVMKGMEEMKDELCEAVFKDLGRDTFVTELIEFGTIKNSAQWDLANIDRMTKDEIVDTELALGPGTTLIHYEPLGVCGIYGAWNYPLLVVLKPLIQCITAGNCALIKPSEVAEHSALAVKNLVEKYLDTECFQVLLGGVDVATKLNNLKLDLICFTGSTFVGKIVAQAAGKNMIPCIMELGGKCPTIIDKTANMDCAVTKVAFGRFINSGQTCIAPDYVLCHESRMNEFITQLRDKVKQMYGEKPTGSDDMGKMINKFHTERMQKILKTAGGEVKMGGNVSMDCKYVEPTIIFEPDREAEIMTDEIFGPILPVFKFNNFSEVIKFVNDRPKPLAIYYMGNHKSFNMDRLQKETSSGALMTNDTLMHLASHYQGFGGVGQSGYGRYSGEEGFKNFSNRKGILIKGPSPRFLSAMVTPPYSEVEKSRLRKVAPYMTITQNQLGWYVRLIMIVTVVGLIYIWWSKRS